jgi:hypothetical protein
MQNYIQDAYHLIPQPLNIGANNWDCATEFIAPGALLR